MKWLFSLWQQTHPLHGEKVDQILTALHAHGNYHVGTR